MFGFDGEYRRRPIQSLGGASQTCDRDTVIKKAQQERQRRNEMRLRNNGATVLQSYTRSFICRQRQKNLERNNFDEYMRTHRDKIVADETLIFLLRRIVFFYNPKEAKDAERLIELCQHILRNCARLLIHAVTEYTWLHRVQRLLDICIKQLRVTQTSQTIPLRMLETFTATSSIERYVEDEKLVQKYLEHIFQYLIAHDYFLRLRELLEVKCPPLDGEILHAPSAFTEALLQLILRPLILLKSTYNQQALQSFAQHILAPVHTEPIRCFLLPCIAQCTDFSFKQLIEVLQDLHKPELLQESSSASMEVDSSTPTAFGIFSTINKQSTAAATQEQQQRERVAKSQLFTSFLFYSLFRLDRQHLAILHSNNLLGAYIKIIAHLSSKFLKLPRSALKSRESQRTFERTQLEHESSDDEDDDNEEHQHDGKDLKSNILSEQEKQVLLDCVDMLNETQRVQTLLDHMQDYINDTEVLFSLCEFSVASHYRTHTCGQRIR